MPDEVKTFSGSFLLDLRIWWRQAHTLYTGDLFLVQERVKGVRKGTFSVKMV